MGEQTRSQGGEQTTAPKGARLEGLAAGADFESLQALFADAVREVAQHTGCARVVAWSLLPGDEPAVLAGSIVKGRVPAPDADLARAARNAVETLDLGAPNAPPELRRLGTELGFSALAPVAPGADGAAGALLVGDAEQPPGRVRPRTLEILESVAARLEQPVRAALAARRLLDLDAEVQRLDRLARLGELVAEIVHEIRNPLVSVKTFLQLLPERIDEPEFRESFLTVASDELRRVERLLDVVLEHGGPARAARGEGRTTVAPTFESVCRLVAHRAAEQGVAIESEATEDLAPVALAADALRQVVLNLVVNAIQVSPRGSRIRLTAQPADDPKPGGAAVELCVEDEGPGVASDAHERLFEPFFTTRPGGVGGLGLSICRRIAEEAGGSIRVESPPAGGAIFRVRLPVA